MKKIALALFVILPGSAVAGQTDPVLDAPCLIVNTSTGECMHYGQPPAPPVDIEAIEAELRRLAVVPCVDHMLERLRVVGIDDEVVRFAESNRRMLEDEMLVDMVARHIRLLAATFTSDADRQIEYVRLRAQCMSEVNDIPASLLRDNFNNRRIEQ